MSNGALSNLSKEQMRRRIAADTDTFVADGGTIEYVAYDPRAERASRVGYWQPLGAIVTDEVDDGWDETETLPDELLGFDNQWGIDGDDYL